MHLHVVRERFIPHHQTRIWEAKYKSYFSENYSIAVESKLSFQVGCCRSLFTNMNFLTLCTWKCSYLPHSQTNTGFWLCPLGMEGEPIKSQCNISDSSDGERPSEDQIRVPCQQGSYSKCLLLIIATYNCISSRLFCSCLSSVRISLEWEISGSLLSPIFLDFLKS